MRDHTVLTTGREHFLIIVGLVIGIAFVAGVAQAQATPPTKQDQATSPKQEMSRAIQDLIPTLVTVQGTCEAECAQARNRGFDPSFKRNPPFVEKATVEIMKSEAKKQNAKLTIRFREDRRLRGIVPVRIGNKSVLLKRTSGTTFTGIVDFDWQTFQEEEKQRASSIREHPKAPVFQRRVLTKTEELGIFEPARRILEINPAVIRNLLGNPANIDPARELMIRDPGVVDDPARTFNPCTNAGAPMGIWTFGHLMTEMANQPVTGIDPSDFVLNWLNAYTNAQTINGWTVAARSIQSFIGSWPKLSNGKLDLSKAPFLLLAIVNRVDLRESFVYGGGGNAGEARFVFGAVNPSASCSQMSVTVIFEYGIKKNSCQELHAWAQQWHNLGTQTLASPVFNVTLQTITDQFTAAGTDPAKPNGSALNQLRTNEIAFGGPWELREFHIVGSGQLQEVVVKQTPDSSLKNTATVRDYINAHEASLLNGTDVVPLQFPGITHFLGGSSIDNFDFWNGPATINNNDARQQLSVSTCNACHGAETSTSFLHVSPRTTGGTAQLSAFLTGETIPDPAVAATQRTYNDLLRRQTDLDTLLNSSCTSRGFLGDLVFRPLVMTH